MIKISFKHDLTDNLSINVVAKCSDINCYHETSKLRLEVWTEDFSDQMELPDVSVLDELEEIACEMLYDKKYYSDLELDYV